MFLDEAAVVERQAFSANEELQQSKTSDPALSCLGASLVSFCVRYRYTGKYLTTEERQEGFPAARALKSKVQSMMAGEGMATLPCACVASPGRKQREAKARALLPSSNSLQDSSPRDGPAHRVGLPVPLKPQNTLRDAS